MEVRHRYGMMPQLLLDLLCVLLTLRLATAFTFTPEDAKVILKKHNEYRRMERASDMYLLHWNISLQERADNWAHRCLFRHERNLDLGENLSFDTDQENQVLLRGLEAWHDEKSQWGYSNQMCKGTCHFSQIVWAYTTTIGCSANVCPSLEVGGRIIKDAMYLVCYYYPRGNLMGQFPYSNGRPCSKCADEDTCSQDLCVSSGPESKLAPDFVKALQPLSPIRLRRPLKAKDAFLALLRRNGQETSGRSSSQQPTQRQDTHLQQQYRDHHHRLRQHQHQRHQQGGFTNTTASISKSVSYSREDHRNAQQPPQHIVRQSYHQLQQSITPAQNGEIPKQDRQHYRHQQQRQPHRYQTQRNQPQRLNPYNQRGTVHAQPASIPTGIDRSPGPIRQSIPSPSTGGASYSRSPPRPPDRRGQVQITQGSELSRDHKTRSENGRTLHLQPAASTLLRPEYHRPTPGTVLISDRNRVITRGSSGRDTNINTNHQSAAVPQRNRVQDDSVRRRQHTSHIDSRVENRSGAGAVSPSQPRTFPVEQRRTTSYVIPSSRNEMFTVKPADTINTAASPWRRTYTLSSRARGRTSAPPHHHHRYSQRWGNGRIHAAAAPAATTAAPVATIVKVLTREEIAARHKAKEDQRRRAYVMRQRYIHRSGTSRVDQKKHAPTDSRSRATESLTPSEIRKKYGRQPRPNVKQDNAQTTSASSRGSTPNTPYSPSLGRTETTTSTSPRPSETRKDHTKPRKNNDKRRNIARTESSGRKNKLNRPTGHVAKKTAISTTSDRQRSEKKEKWHPHKKNYVMGRDGRRCVDRHPECPRWLAKCHKSAAVTISCPLSCGKCGKHVQSGVALGYSRVKTSYHVDRRRRNPPGYHRGQRSQRKRKRQDRRRVKKRRRLFLKKQMREDNSSQRPRSRRNHERSKGERLSRRKRKRPSSTQNRPGFCRDDPKHTRSCKYWAKLGYCSENRLIKSVYCRLSCATCG